MSQRESQLEAQLEAKMKQINEIKMKMMKTLSPSMKNSLKQQALSLLKQKKMFHPFNLIKRSLLHDFRIENQLISIRVSPLPLLPITLNIPL